MKESVTALRERIRQLEKPKRRRATAPAEPDAKGTSKVFPRNRFSRDEVEQAIRIYKSGFRRKPLLVPALERELALFGRRNSRPRGEFSHDIRLALDDCRTYAESDAAPETPEPDPIRPA